MKLESRVNGFEAREDISNSNSLAIQLLIKKFEMLDAEFHQYHFAIIDLLEDEVNLEEEQAVLDNHNEKITDLMERLQHLALKSEVDQYLSTTTDPSQPLRKQLHRTERRARMVQTTMESLTPGPDLDQWSVRQLEEEIGILKAV